MIKDGLFQKFPCDEVYGLHNAPDLNHGEIGILPGPAMAGADSSTSLSTAMARMARCLSDPRTRS